MSFDVVALAMLEKDDPGLFKRMVLRCTVVPAALVLAVAAAQLWVFS